jgi:hypothetical protein
MKSANELSHNELVELVDILQKKAFKEDAEDGTPFAGPWVHNRGLDADFIGEVIELLGAYGLAPETPAC